MRPLFLRAVYVSRGAARAVGVRLGAQRGVGPAESGGANSLDGNWALGRSILATGAFFFFFPLSKTTPTTSRSRYRPGGRAGSFGICTTACGMSRGTVARAQATKAELVASSPNQLVGRGFRCALLVNGRGSLLYRVLELPDQIGDDRDYRLSTARRVIHYTAGILTARQSSDTYNHTDQAPAIRRWFFGAHDTRARPPGSSGRIAD
jgi:hypothetical protein